jgi:hypothetical protein
MGAFFCFVIVRMMLGMHQFQFRPIPILRIGRNWFELELELVGIGSNWNWNWSELVGIGIGIGLELVWNWSELVGIGRNWFGIIVGIDRK